MSRYKNMTNNEIMMEMRNLENKYESDKEKAAKLLNNMAKYDKEYIEAKQELLNRSRGIF